MKQKPATNSLQSEALSEIRDAMVPFAAILRESGLTWSQVRDAFRYGMVQSAKNLMRDRTGSEPTKSQIALACELSRPLVNEHWDTEPVALEEKAPLPAKVMAKWSSSARWTDDVGRPLDLPFSGIRSFTELCSTVSQKVRARTFLESLEEIGNVEVMDNGHVRFCRIDTRNVDQSDLITGILRNLKTHLETLHTNLRTPNHLYEQLFDTTQIPPNKAETVQEECREELRKFVKTKLIPILSAAEIEGETFDRLAWGFYQAHQKMDK